MLIRKSVTVKDMLLNDKLILFMAIHCFLSTETAQTTISTTGLEQPL